MYQYNTNSTQHITISYNEISGTTKQYNAHTINEKQSKSIHDYAPQYNSNGIQMQYNTIQHNTTQYNTMHYNTMQYNTSQTYHKHKNTIQVTQ